jgi:GTPase SAR1 family protein
MFTGREEDLQCLTTAFALGQPSQRHQQRRFVPFGLGGSGKTQICLKYVQDQRERYEKESDLTSVRLFNDESTYPALFVRRNADLCRMMWGRSGA